MKMLYVLLILPLSVTWVDPTRNELPDDSLVFNEEEAPEMIHMQLPGEPDDEYKLVGTFSTRPNHKQTMSKFKMPTADLPSAYQNAFNDPYWKFQWYQQDYRTSEGPVIDHNIVPVQRMGFNGEGITIGIIGEELSAGGHPDFKLRVRGIFNTIKVISKSVIKMKTPPVARKKLRPITNMATKMAGVIAMNANNSRCGVGIAYNAELIGITVMDDTKPLYDGDIVEGLKPDLTSLHIYVDAIVKRDDGMDLPFSKKIRKSLASIATMGRGKNGGIYVVGAGDGKSNGDHCGADDIVNSIHTFAIGSASWLGKPTFYGERCSAIIATAYSSYVLSVRGGAGVPGVVTIEGDDSCTKNFGGTAASAAIASGIFALTLQANPDLTWRDLMHLIAMTSEKAPLFPANGWNENGAGFWVNRNFGFGLLNAENMVIASKRWNPVPKMITCKLRFKRLDKLEKGGRSTTGLVVNHCPSLNDPEVGVKYIEQVELVTTIWYRIRGDISITLTSPNGTNTILFEPRPNDVTDQGFNNWSMRSVHFWGEQPFGTWVLVVDAKNPDYTEVKVITLLIMMFSEDMLKAASLGYIGDKIRRAELVIHGTSDLPKHYRNTPPDQRRTYAYSPEDDRKS